ncbi:hypothetical protein [Roseateles oligotrophus]|uniref:Uncharacterized protein n=1 Tax=Roseateles oligotrophus TaxID=1769250 RepID=A0ABT2YCX2_9BURK|nr:hypothetical protein [Roseateles oligotrophus]MCV2367890.1 hypothetical protein [Roseateles oligotrophus]
MILNLTDPASIVNWWKVLPERHGPQLQAFARLRPQFAQPIRVAVRRIKADPELRHLFERGIAAESAHADEVAPRHYKDDPADALLAA